MIRLIAAIDRRRGIGKHDVEPWFIPKDERYFQDQVATHGGAILVGGNTFRVNLKGKAWPGHKTYLLTTKDDQFPDVTLVHDLEEFLQNTSEDIWVIGGAQVYAQVIASGHADELYLTHIDADFNCDHMFPEYADSFTLAERTEDFEENGFRFYFAKYARKCSND